MTAPQGYVIGIKEVFEEVRGLRDTLTSHMAGQDLKVQAIDHRVKVLEDDKVDREKEKADAASLRRMVWGAILSSLFLPIIVGVILALIL